MKPYQRRKGERYPYYKLATWDPISLTWRDGKKAYTAIADAIKGLPPGKYRMSIVGSEKRTDFAPFTVDENGVPQGLVVLGPNEYGFRPR